MLAGRFGLIVHFATEFSVYHLSFSFSSLFLLMTLGGLGARIQLLNR
jgi:hypothetical protein